MICYRSRKNHSPKVILLIQTPEYYLTPVLTFLETPLEQKLVNYLLQNRSLNFLEKLTFGHFALELTKIMILNEVQTLIEE